VGRRQHGCGNENLEKKAAEISAIAGYKSQFDAVFPGEGVTPTTIVKALSPTSARSSATTPPTTSTRRATRRH